MQTIELNTGDQLVIDPCYIKHIKNERYDAIKHVATLHDGDDGVYTVEWRGERYTLGVDSGRTWVLQAEFPTTVEVDSGLSGHAVVRAER